MSGGAKHERIESIRAKSAFDEVEDLGILFWFIDNPTLGQPLNIGARRQCIGWGEGRIETDRVKTSLQHHLGGLAREGIGERQTAQIVIVCIQVLRALSACPFNLGLLDRGLQDADHSLGNLILQLKQVFDGPIILIGPYVVARR